MRTVLTLLLLLPSIAFPSTTFLVNVTGTDNDDILFGPNQAVAVSFTTTQSFSNVTFSVPVTELICLNCAGVVYLERVGSELAQPSVI